MNPILAEQLALDYHCSAEQVIGGGNVFSIRKNLPGRRIFRSDSAFIKICSVGGKLLISCDERLYDWCVQTYEHTGAAWFSLYPNLKRLDKKLEEYGQTVADCHHFYLPEREVSLPAQDFSVSWYEKDELEKFRGDTRFFNALSFLPESPDVLAVTAVADGKILGMAGASADSETMWQIGIDVVDEAQGKGIGTSLTVLLKDEIIKRGKLPFYGTAETHMKSQRVAVKSGFVPAWAEIYSEKIL